MRSFVICNSFLKMLLQYHQDVTMWYHRDVTLWYHRDVTLRYQNLISLGYLCDVTNWCHSNITNLSNSDISCDISVTSLWHQIVDWVAISSKKGNLWKPVWVLIHLGHKISLGNLFCCKGFSVVVMKIFLDGNEKNKHLYQGANNC